MSSSVHRVQVPVTALDVSRDCKRILGNQFADVVLWTAKAPGKVLRTLLGHRDSVTSVRCSWCPSCGGSRRQAGPS